MTVFMWTSWYQSEWAVVSGKRLNSAGTYLHKEDMKCIIVLSFQRESYMFRDSIVNKKRWQHLTYDGSSVGVSGFLYLIFWSL